MSHDEIVTCVDQKCADLCKSESSLKLRFQQSSFVCEAHLSPGQLLLMAKCTNSLKQIQNSVRKVLTSQLNLNYM